MELDLKCFNCRIVFYLEGLILEVEAKQHKKNPAEWVHDVNSHSTIRNVMKCRIVFILRSKFEGLKHYNIKKILRWNFM
ncbi:hypothetical protein COI44_21280 [Bacillus sp. AFS088145]|nr:hypothetical protein COI44_21280 [Bacillus sp. AFS088145]